MAKKTPHFFTYGNNPIAKLPDYLDSMLKRMASGGGLNKSGNTTMDVDVKMVLTSFEKKFSEIVKDLIL